ncbi:hypothetical protein G9A89_001110 [Geosiphon pyriformis]|nr:hypothetical protein G9A89_001110 [Geosiphon pyriformis]
MSTRTLTLAVLNQSAYQIWNDRPVLQLAREHVRLVKAPETVMRLNPRDSIQIHNVPLISPLHEKASEELTQEERVARIEDRFQELEGFLSDYFIDTGPLRRFKDQAKDDPELARRPSSYYG